MEDPRTTEYKEVKALAAEKAVKKSKKKITWAKGKKKK